MNPSDPLGGVKNLQVLNPTMTTLNVRWEPAEGRVKEYRVIYTPAAGGAESVVGLGGVNQGQNRMGVILDDSRYRLWFGCS